MWPFKKQSKIDKPDNDYALRLTGQAIRLVEVSQDDEAIRLLNQAIQIDPTCCHAYNELAFIYGRHRMDFDRAEENARKAVDCDPGNPKFHNTVLGIQIDRARRMGSKRKLDEKLEDLLAEARRRIQSAPEYAPGYLSEAELMALAEGKKSDWEQRLEKAESLYKQYGRSALGVNLPPEMASLLIARSRARCQQLAELREDLPD